MQIDEVPVLAMAELVGSTRLVKLEQVLQQ